jgi:hypothetical protein
LAAPINIDEHGVDVGFYNIVWTGTDEHGNADPPYTCLSWQTSSSDYGGDFGVTERTDGYWTFNPDFYYTCDIPLRLYCFEQ